jgi:cytidylate kinase
MVLARTYGEAAELPSDAGRGQLDDDRYIKTLTSVIKGVAGRGNVVILGRGAQAILQHDAATLHVYVAAPRQQRIATLVEREGMTAHDAEHRIKQRDQHRQAFYHRYFKVDADSPQLYDLGINAGRVRIDVAAKMIAVAAHALDPRPG